MKTKLVIILLAGSFLWPQWINTKQDYLNLLSLPQHRERAIQELRKIYELDDATVQRVISGTEENKNMVTKEIDNPAPLYKRFKFDSKEEIKQLLLKNGVDLEK